MRRSRELRTGARYHVTARANRQEMILENHVLKELFISVLKRAKRKYVFRLENFSIMGNHFHLIIQPGHGECLSRIMQWIMSVFAMAFNKIMGFHGHVWGCRFFSRILENLRSFLQVFAYIDENPVKAHQIDDRRNWLWGGLIHHRTGNTEVVETPGRWVMLQFPEHGLYSIVDQSSRKRRE